MESGTQEGIMLRKSKVLTAAATAAVAIAVPAGSASAQDQDGLVNVLVTNTQIAVPVSVAANICDANVAVLADQVGAGGTSCTSTAQSEASHRGGNGGGNVSQDGLVNIAVTNTQIAVPVAVAANLCDVNVGILARQLQIGDTQCNATANSLASHGTGGGGGGTL
jgi:hypothetical protein